MIEVVGDSCGKIRVVVAAGSGFYRIRYSASRNWPLDLEWE